MIVELVDECVVLPVQFVNRQTDTDEEGTSTEDLQLYAAVLCVGRKGGVRQKKFNAWVLFKLIDTENLSAEERDELSSRFGRPLKKINIIDESLVFEGLYQKDTPKLFFTVLIHDHATMSTGLTLPYYRVIP